jgi:hypothetical protein
VRAFGLALAGVLTVTVTTAAHIDGSGSDLRPLNAGPAPSIVLAWDGGPSTRQVGATGDHPTAGHPRQWNGGWVSPHWRPNRQHRQWGPYGWQGVPTYWVWGPSGGAFDYPDLLGESP